MAAKQHQPGDPHRQPHPRDPELRSLPSGTSVCWLRLAVNTRRKDNATGEWMDKPNYFDVTVWGRQGENAAQYLSKGRPIALDGRLEWREWQDKDGNKRQSVEIVADNVQFLCSPEAPGAAARQRLLAALRRPGRHRRLPAHRHGRAVRAGRRRHPLLARYELPAPRHLWPWGRALRRPGRPPGRHYPWQHSMAKQRNRRVRRRDRKGGPGSGRRKSCPYCRDKVDQVDYRDISAPAPVHLRAREDPLPADHRRVPAAPGPDRPRGQARA